MITCQNINTGKHVINCQNIFIFPDILTSTNKQLNFYRINTFLFKNLLLLFLFFSVTVHKQILEQNVCVHVFQECCMPII